MGFMGAHLGADEVAIVTELCAGGSLWRALHGQPRPAGGRITWSNRWVGGGWEGAWAARPGGRPALAGLLQQARRWAHAPAPLAPATLPRLLDVSSIIHTSPVALRGSHPCTPAPHPHPSNPDSGGRVALGIARGLHYLHTKARVVHLDLKSPNVRVTVSNSGASGWQAG